MSAPDLPSTPVRPTRVGAVIADDLRRLVYEGLRPGDRIGTEAALAKRFGVSRITMRDAVRTLEAEGVVEVAVGAGGGIRVAQSRPEHLGEALAIQLHLLDVGRDELAGAMHAMEPEIVRLAAENATPPDLTRLRSLVERSRVLREDADAFTVSALDFHLELARLSGNRVLLETVRALRSAQRRRFRAEASRTTADRVVRYHAAIVDAMERHDVEGAVDAMREHLALVSAASS